MKKFQVSELAPGVSFTKAVYLDKDTIFVSPETVITESDIEKLKKFGIKEVLTNGELVTASNNENAAVKTSDSTKSLFANEVPEDQYFLKVIFEEINNKRNEFFSLYNESLSLIKSTYTAINEDKNIELSPVRALVEKLVDHIKDNTNFSYILLGMPVTGYYLYTQVNFALFYSLLIGYYLNLSRPKLVDLGIAAFFADIGMTKIPASISEKTTKLTEDEFKIFIKHPLVGFQILTQKIKLKSNLAAVSLQHHENFNGTGYPQKLVGDRIEEYSRIYTIADNFSALINNRPWRKKSLPYEVMKNMISADVNKFDLGIIKIFLAKLSMYPLGSAAELSDGRTGIVIYSNQDKPLRPALRIVRDEAGNDMRKLEFVNLLKESHIFITKAVDSHIFNI